MELNEKEMRELDAVIAERVMGMSLIKTPSLATDIYVTSDRLERLMMGPQPLKRYTIDPAAAMEVLEKVIKDSKKSVCQCLCSEGFEVYHGGGDYIKSTRKAKTLPLAICLFAKGAFDQK